MFIFQSLVITMFSIAGQKILLSVILAERDIRMVSKKPDSIYNMVIALKHLNFLIQYEDPGFANVLCNITDIPKLQDPEEALNDSANTTDTKIISTSSQKIQNQWPTEFEILSFTVYLKYCQHGV